MADYVMSDLSQGGFDNESIGNCPDGKLSADPVNKPNARRARLARDESVPVDETNNNKNRASGHWQVHWSEFATSAGVYIKTWPDEFSQDT